MVGDRVSAVVHDLGAQQAVRSGNVADAKKLEVIAHRGDRLRMIAGQAPVEERDPEADTHERRQGQGAQRDESTLHRRAP
ncbi:hypothetical protein GCM10022255_087280 [Dactylosporangium darangshiense]|uniref:Uncharacterized protein n=1 Tax=Dactylosporangium darangshiense TaxID=579108 RepID=A0ABP8DN15_9ACTN